MCRYVCIRVHTCTYVHIRVHTETCVYIYTCTYVYIRVLRVPAYMHTYIHAYIHACIHTFAHTLSSYLSVCSPHHCVGFLFFAWIPPGLRSFASSSAASSSLTLIITHSLSPSFTSHLNHISSSLIT